MSQVKEKQRSTNSLADVEQLGLFAAIASLGYVFWVCGAMEMVERLADDHANARRFAEQASQIPGISIDIDAVETNLVFFSVDPAWGTAAQLSQALRERGVLINPAGGTHRLRACTHLDVSATEIDAAVSELRDIMSRSAVIAEQSSTGSYG